MYNLYIIMYQFNTYLYCLTPSAKNIYECTNDNFHFVQIISSMLYNRHFTVTLNTINGADGETNETAYPRVV